MRQCSIRLLLGPIGCIIGASLPERTIEEVEDERLRRLEDARVRREEENDRQASLETEANQRRQDAKAQADAAKMRRAQAVARCSDWFDSVILKFGWYKALPEVIQPIVVGIGVALPFVVVLILIFKGR